MHRYPADVDDRGRAIHPEVQECKAVDPITDLQAALLHVFVYPESDVVAGLHRLRQGQLLRIAERDSYELAIVLGLEEWDDPQPIKCRQQSLTIGHHVMAQHFDGYRIVLADRPIMRADLEGRLLLLRSLVDGEKRKREMDVEDLDYLVRNQRAPLPSHEGLVLAFRPLPLFDQLPMVLLREGRLEYSGLM